MDSRSIIFGALATMLCGALCDAMLIFAPGGTLALNQFVILCGGTLVGLTTACLVRPIAPEQSRFLSRSWPVAVVAAGSLLLLCAIVAPYPVARILARDIVEKVSRDCRDSLRTRPDSSSFADCRKLEWQLRRAEGEMHQVSVLLQQHGFHRSADLRLVDSQLRPSFEVASAEVRPHGLPAVGSDQRRRISDRLRSQADALAAAAVATKLPVLIQWAEQVRNEVYQFTTEGAATS